MEKRIKPKFLKYILLYVVLLIQLHVEAQTEEIADTTNNESYGKYALTAAYFGETITHPGLTVGLEYTFWEGRKINLVSSVNLGGYIHPRHHKAMFLELQGGLRRISSYGLYFDFLIGAGYFHTWADGDVYVANDQGDVEEISNVGRPHLMTNLALGIGWDFYKKGSLPLKLFLHVKPLFIYPVNQNLLIQGAIVAGGTWQLKHK